MAAADRRAAEDRAEIERLTACLTRANSNHEEYKRRWYLAIDERDTAIRLYDQLGEELEQIVGGDSTSLERLRRLERERDAYRAAAADLLSATHDIDDPSQSLIAYRARARDLLKNGPDEQANEESHAR